MVTRVANNTSINLNNPAELYGVENDVIFVFATNANSFESWAGDDVIDASRATFTGFISNFYGGLGDDQIAGSGGLDWIFDGAGNDIVLAGAGADRVHADIGNDIYYGGAGIDMIDFRYLNVLGSGFSDPMTEGVSFDLANHGVQNLGLRGFDQFFGFENINGSSLNDNLFGDGGANEITSGEGNDFLDGRGGADSLTGQDGSDTYVGGAGADQLTLSEFTAARDFVRYTNISESGTHPSTFDTILGFVKGTAATADRIDLSRIDANLKLAGNQAFLFKGSAAFNSAAGEVRLVTSGLDTFVYVDNDADAAPEMIIKVQGVTGLIKADFIL